MRKLTFGQMATEMRNAREKGLEMCAVIVYAQSNFDKEYSTESLSYKVSNQCNYFDDGKISKALWGANLDGTDPCVRLDYYDWKIDYCYIVEE